MGIGIFAPMGDTDISAAFKPQAGFVPRGTPPRRKTRVRFAAQRQIGMSGFRKEVIDLNVTTYKKRNQVGIKCAGIIRHPTKGKVYGYVALDGALVYTR